MFGQMIRLWTEIKVDAAKHSEVFSPVLNDKFITSYSARDCYMEKQRLQWVEISTLLANLRPTRRNSLPLRYSFSVLFSLMLENGNLDV